MRKTKRRTRCAVCGKRVGKGLLTFCQPHWIEFIQSPETKARVPVLDAVLASPLPDGLRMGLRHQAIAAFERAFIRRVRKEVRR